MISFIQIKFKKGTCKMLLNKTKKIKQIKELQKQNIENNKHDEYMVGVHNGIEISLAILENREPIFVNVLKEPTTTEKVEQIGRTISNGIRRK